MKQFNRMIDIVLYSFAAIMLIAAVSTAIWNKPVLLSAIRSNSMYPLFERGDMVVINNLSNEDDLSIGEIVVFRAEEGDLASKGYVVHRIADGNKENGYITKGDANDYSDQAVGNPPIKREWIVSRVAFVNDRPVGIPLIGYLPIWMESLQTNRYALPVIAVLLTAVIGFSESKKGKKTKIKRKFKLEMQPIYFWGGVTISIIMAATMIATSQRITFIYEISENDRGVIMGSSAGILRIGDEVEQPLADLKNNGFLPVAAVITTEDDQLSFSHSHLTMNQGDTLKTQVHLKASRVGTYHSVIHVGLFYQLLPSKIIYRLASQSYWLALVIISLIPGVPLMIYPLIDRKMRRQTGKVFRHKLKHIRNRLTFG